MLLAAPPAHALGWLDLLDRLRETGHGTRADVVDTFAEIERWSRHYSIPAHWLAAILMTESRFDPCAVPPEGDAAGIAQLRPKTARYLGVADPFDPRQAIRGAAAYAAEGYRRARNFVLASAYYHAGPKVLTLPPARWGPRTRRYARRLIPSRMRAYRNGQWKRLLAPYRLVPHANARWCRTQRAAWKGRWR